MLDIMCHFASFLEALAFFQTDMVRLRAIEVVAMTMLAVYSLMHTDGDIFNSSIFLLNFFNSVDLYSNNFFLSGLTKPNFIPIGVSLKSALSHLKDNLYSALDVNIL